MEPRTYSEEQKAIKRKRLKRARTRRLIVTLFLLMCLVAASVVAVYYYGRYKESQLRIEELTAENDALLMEYTGGRYITVDAADELVKEAVDSAVNGIEEETGRQYKDTIRGFMENGETLTMLENIFDDQIVVPDTGRYWFFDVDNSLAQSAIDREALVYPEYDEEEEEYVGEPSYSKDDVTAVRGIDVSKFQGNIDWDKVKNDDVGYAYIRLGYRGYESGKIVTDEKYEDNIEGCNRVGLDCGVYFFTEAINEAEGREEAEFVLEHLEGYHTELPIVLDVEQSANVYKSRTRNLTYEERTKIVIAFCERIKEAGYTPMIYGNLKSMMVMLDFSQLEEYDKWFAYYRSPLRFPYKIKMWQYSASGEVDGIKGDADLNLMFY